MEHSRFNGGIVRSEGYRRAGSREACRESALSEIEKVRRPLWRRVPAARDGELKVDERSAGSAWSR